MFSDYISKQERLACMKAGALAYAGMLDAELGPLPEVKEAGILDTLKGSADAAKTLYVLAAAGAGIPLGIFSHVMARRIAGKRLREEELKEKIRLYQTAADEMASGLSGGEV
jgi:hypothetical protein